MVYVKRRMSKIKKSCRPKKRRRVLTINPMRGMKSDLQTFDQRSTLAMTNANATYACLNFPVPGTGTNTRIGDKIRIRNIRVRFIIQQINTPALEYGRIILFWDSQPNGAFPASPLPLLSVAIEDQPNPDYAYRFKILKDILIQYGSATLSTSKDGLQEIQNYYTKTDLTTQFSAGAGGIADIASGSLCIMTLNNTAVNPATLVYASRIHYEN